MSFPQIKYRATFADGTVKTRKTDRTYTHAWKVGSKIGFAGSAALAQQGDAARYAKWWNRPIEVVAVELLNPEVLPIREELLAKAKAEYDADPERRPHNENL